MCGGGGAVLFLCVRKKKSKVSEKSKSAETIYSTE